MKKDAIKLLAVFNAILYTSLGFQAVTFGYTAILFLTVPIVTLSLVLTIKK